MRDICPAYKFYAAFQLRDGNAPSVTHWERILIAMPHVIILSKHTFSRYELQRRTAVVVGRAETACTGQSKKSHGHSSSPLLLLPPQPLWSWRHVKAADGVSLSGWKALKDAR